MNTDGSANVRADLAIGARLPHLLWIGIGVLGAGGLLLLVGAGGLFAAVPRRLMQPSQSEGWDDHQ